MTTLETIHQHAATVSRPDSMMHSGFDVTLTNGVLAKIRIRLSMMYRPQLDVTLDGVSWENRSMTDEDRTMLTNLQRLDMDQSIESKGSEAERIRQIMLDMGYTDA